MGGGNLCKRLYLLRRRGLSPRGRGKRVAGRRNSIPRRSIPAWAGETRHDRGVGGQSGVYPRVGGGNPFYAPTIAAGAGLSPRGRGKHAVPKRRKRVSRSIPAWAGETEPGTSAFLQYRVYPRVGGGNSYRRGVSIPI